MIVGTTGITRFNSKNHFWLLLIYTRCIIIKKTILFVFIICMITTFNVVAEHDINHTLEDINKDLREINKTLEHINEKLVEVNKTLSEINSRLDKNKTLMDDINENTIITIILILIIIIFFIITTILYSRI